MTATKSRPPKRKSTSEKAALVNAEYENNAKELLRAAMVRSKVSYEELAERINSMGIEITARGLENKISRGSFSAAFFLQCADALEFKVNLDS
ncbi:DUF6471 domain-containing protein [Hyphomonas atlantica corrig.]|uniref:DUF6471 domain-containing protein n=1 Tax=Hyphomonas atlantica TaxID=1280948 RepID=UPI003B58E9B9